MAKQQRPEPAQPDAVDNPAAPSFEEALARLEEIAGRLEEGRLGLGESLACYEEGIKCLKQCYALLEQAERKIELLSGIDAEGHAITVPFDDAASTLEEKASNRGRRRSRPTPPPADEPEPSAGDVDEGELLF